MRDDNGNKSISFCGTRSPSIDYSHNLLHTALFIYYCCCLLLINKKNGFSSSIVIKSRSLYIYNLYILTLYTEFGVILNVIKVNVSQSLANRCTKWLERCGKCL